MPPVPAEQISPFGGYNAAAEKPNLISPFPHLTSKELAARWRCTVFTISGKYRKLGLRPIRLGKRLLFPLDRIEAVERRLMGGK